MRTLLSLLLLTVPVFAADTWPKVEYAEVRAYHYLPDRDKPLLLDGKVNRTVLNGDGMVLNENQTKRLIEAVTSDTRYQAPKSSTPRHCLVFYDLQRKPVAYVDICLACMNGTAQPGAPGSIDFPALADLLEELKLPLGPYAPDAKTYRKERESWRIAQGPKK